MTTSTRFEAGPFGLAAEARARLGRHAEAAVKLARARGSAVIAAVTVPIPAALDLSAAVLCGRRAGERAFCLEHPDRDGFALAALGQAAAVDASGRDRFKSLVEGTRSAARGAFVDEGLRDTGRPSHAGPAWVGGFAFAAEGGASPEWDGLPPGEFVMPELLLARQDGEARMTVVAVLDGDQDPESAVDRLAQRAGELQASEMPLADPDPVGTPSVTGAAPPSHYEGAVARAVERIRAGELGKVVLAREVRVHSARPIHAAPVYDGLRTVFPGCYSYLLAGEGWAFTGASPELLVRREGFRAQTVALAGTTRRSADPSVDAHLGEQLLNSPKDREEQAIVARRIERTLEPHSVWVTAAPEPGLVQVHNVQHLATPIRAQLAAPVPVLELAGRLHPTPAVGGEPSELAQRVIPELEGLDRGWYAGGVGYSGLGEDGEFCVAIRCALLRGQVAHLYAGCGIVRDSVPSDELAESEVKLQALLPLLT